MHGAAHYLVVLARKEQKKYKKSNWHSVLRRLSPLITAIHQNQYMIYTVSSSSIYSNKEISNYSTEAGAAHVSLAAWTAARRWYSSTFLTHLCNATMNQSTPAAVTYSRPSAARRYCTRDSRLSPSVAR